MSIRNTVVNKEQIHLIKRFHKVTADSLISSTDTLQLTVEAL